MLLDHEEGYKKFKELQSKFEIELEMECLNSHFMPLPLLRQRASIVMNIHEKYPGQSLFKESEHHTKQHPSYEFSFFCNKEDLNFFKNLLQKEGLQIDLIHDNQAGT